jgi:orotate phosphoribosyltransferase
MIIEEFMRKHEISCIGGLELGAVPVVSAVSFASFVVNNPVHAFFVRKQPKGHDAKELIDGDLPDGSDVLMVDDVTTSGGSIITAIDQANTEKRCGVRWALSIVDRDQGAAKLLASRKIALASIFTKADFGL